MTLVRDWQAPGDDAGAGYAACACCPRLCHRARRGASATGNRAAVDDDECTRACVCVRACRYHEQALAAFLVTRPPFAFIGSRELRDASWDPLFALDVGEPLGLCAEGPPLVFARNWTKGTASLDCNTYSAVLPFPSLPAEAVYRPRGTD